MTLNLKATILSVKRISTLLLLAIIQGCITLTPIVFDEVVPASSYVDKRVSNVMLINLAPIQRSPSYQIVLPNKAPIAIDSVWCDDFNEVVLSKFYEDLDTRQFFDTVLIDTLSFDFYAQQLKSNSLSAILDSICYSSNTNGVFFISHCNYGSSLFVEPIYDNLYWGYLEARGVARLGFYNSVSQSFDDTYFFADSLFINGSSGTLTEFNSSLPTPTSFIRSVGEKLGHQFVNRYVPYWQTVERTLFSGGNYFFILGGDAIKQEDWNTAIQSYHFAIDKGSRRTKARAAYNLAVMAEMRGDISSALAWINSSKEFYALLKWKREAEFAMINAYKEKLKLRLIAVNKLTQQLSNSQ